MRAFWEDLVDKWAALTELSKVPFLEEHWYLTFIPAAILFIYCVVHGGGGNGYITPIGTPTKNCTTCAHYNPLSHYCSSNQRTILEPVRQLCNRFETQVIGECYPLAVLESTPLPLAIIGGVLFVFLSLLNGADMIDHFALFTPFIDGIKYAIAALPLFLFTLLGIFRLDHPEYIPIRILFSLCVCYVFAAIASFLSAICMLILMLAFWFVSLLFKLLGFLFSI